MEIMAQLVNKKIILLVLFLFLSIKNIAQQKIDKDIAFSYKEEGKTRYMQLNQFLSTFEVDKSFVWKDCMVNSGIFKFTVNTDSKVVSIDVEGNLPDAIVKSIKNKIMLTENHWIFSKSKKQQKKSIKFFFPFYLSIYVEKNCDLKDHYEPVSWVKEFLNGQKIKDMGNNLYLIHPEFWNAYR
jgi:hypothetical protein